MADSVQSVVAVLLLAIGISLLTVHDLENLIAMLPSMALQSAWYLSNVTTPSDILTT